MAMEDAITVAGSDGEESGGRPQRRTRKPSAKVRQNEGSQNSLKAVVLSSEKLPGSGGTAINGAHTGRSGDGVEDEQTLLQTLQEQMNVQTGILKALLENNQAMRTEISRVKEELNAVKDECQSVKDELVTVKTRLDNITALTTGQSSPNPSYADIARSPPTSQPSNVRTLSTLCTTPSTLTSTLYCTIDTSRVENEAREQSSAGAIRKIVEDGIRTKQDNSSWRCRAVTVHPRNPCHVRIACRDEEEHNTVKRVIEANLTRGARLLRDDLHPIRVDSVNRAAALDEAGNDRAEAAEEMGKENDTQVAKVRWLSSRDPSKEYGSIVVYLTKNEDAQHFLREGFFYAGGQSGYTKTFERRTQPKQCYKCQEITDHKAYQCKKTQICGRCAKEGHRHSECTEAILKCVPCGGPHESFSKNCRKLYPSQHE